MLVEDKKFLKLMENNCSKEGKHYMLLLPITVLNKPIAKNKIISEERLKNIYKGFIRHKQCHKD